jgi:hypothetical protein
LKFWTALCCLLPLCAVIAGCGPGRLETTPISGRVTYRGKPVPNGRIVFQPEEGRPAMAALDADGRYRLTTFKPGDGALLGKHRVTIEATRQIGNAPQPKSRAEEFRLGAGGRPPVIEWLVPEKYARLRITPLKAEVTRSANTVNFDLPTEP